MESEAWHESSMSASNSGLKKENEKMTLKKRSLDLILC